jgi:hypothetical protein
MNAEIETLRSALDEIAYARWPSCNGDDPVTRIQAFAKDALALASGMSASGQDPKGLEAKPASPVTPKAADAQDDAP